MTPVIETAGHVVHAVEVAANDKTERGVYIRPPDDNQPECVCGTRVLTLLVDRRRTNGTAGGLISEGFGSTDTGNCICVCDSMVFVEITTRMRQCVPPTTAANSAEE